MYIDLLKHFKLYISIKSDYKLLILRLAQFKVKATTT